MKKLECVKGYDEVDKLYEKQDLEGLFNFDNDKIGELVEFMDKTFSKPISDEKQKAIIGCFRDYLFIYKGKSLQEAGADLCTLLGIFEIIDSMTE